MKFIKFVIAFAITVGLIYLLDQPLKLPSATLPAMGKLLSPTTGFWQNQDNLSDQNITIPEGALSASVEVIYDDRLVPHIFAQNEVDAAYVQGYVTAQHRLWQMDISTRAAVGRLAEVLGENLVERDKLQRRRGMLYAAKKSLNVWSENKKVFDQLQAYSDGVNAYINTLDPKDYPIEYKLLGYHPEFWSPLHTILFSKSMAQTLCLREDDIEATNALSIWGEDVFNFLYPEQNPLQSPIIPDEVQWEFAPEKVSTDSSQMIGQIPHRTYEKPSPFIGSNNWAVSGSKTKSGNPILCNDPHLGLSLPSIWYELQIHTPTLNAYGVSLPGVPGIIIGFNKDIAWGVTNAGHDVLDWYKITWADEDKTKYLLDGVATNVREIIEVIKVKDGSTIRDTVKYTTWGPIVYEDSNSDYYDMAMRWIAHDTPNNKEMEVFTGLNKAKSYEECVEALEPYHAPAQNFVLASRQGDIGIKPQGNFPIKADQQGRFVQDGSKSTNGWKGFIPKDQNPAVKNPSSGYVGSANQSSTNEDYPYYYNGNFDNYRGRVLHRKLSQMEDITVEDMMQLQNDNFSIEAEELLPLLLKKLDRSNIDDAEKQMLVSLIDWNYSFEKDLLAPTLYEIWSEEFYKVTWDELYAVNDSIDVLFPRTWRTIALLKDMPDNAFFDVHSTPEKETGEDVVLISFKNMSTKAKDLKEKGKPLKWGAYKGTQINHLGQIPAFADFNVPIGGYHHALNAVQKSFGPSWRMIVELGDQVNAYGIYPGGQSGNPASKYYNNMVEDWAIGKYYPLNFVEHPDKMRDKELFVQVFK